MRSGCVLRSNKDCEENHVAVLLQSAPITPFVFTLWVAAEPRAVLGTIILFHQPHMPQCVSFKQIDRISRCFNK